MEQQLSRSRLGVRQLARWRISADMDSIQKRLTIFDPHVTVAQIRAMHPQRLDLGAKQREPGLESLLDKEVVPRLAIIDDQFESVGGGVGGRLGHYRSLSAESWKTKATRFASPIARIDYRTYIDRA